LNIVWLIEKPVDMHAAASGHDNARSEPEICDGGAGFGFRGIFEINVSPKSTDDPAILQTSVPVGSPRSDAEIDVIVPVLFQEVMDSFRSVRGNEQRGDCPLSTDRPEIDVTVARMKQGTQESNRS
jgi:hypothetical protein